MDCSSESGGRIGADGSGAGRFLSHADVVERLVEAAGFARRMPDREAAWIGRVRAMWPAIRRHAHFGDYANEEPEDRPRLPGLRSAEVDRMDEAFGWVERHVFERDRKLVGIVIAQLERGEGRPSWTGAARALGWTRHPDTLAKRFDAAITRVCHAVNGANSQG